jgi:small conductance mechanosensitive channel
VFRVSAVDNTNVSERAKQIERRMNRLLENPTAISPLRIETSKNNQERIITSA